MRVVVLFVCFCFVTTCFAENKKEPIVDLSTNYEENIDFVKRLNDYAAELFGNSLTDDEIENSINSIKRELDGIPSQKILLTDLILLYRERLLDKAREADLHFCISPVDSFNVSEGLPFCMICKDGHLYVEYSEDKKIKRGDEILSINSVSKDEILRYSYKWRYYDGNSVLRRCHYMYSDKYNVEFKRNDKIQKCAIKGVEKCETPFRNTIIFNKEKVGYFNLQNFIDDKLPEKMSVFIDSLQKLGISDLIIDIRKNGGGNSNMINDFFSIMSDAPNYEGFRAAKIKISPYTKEAVKQMFGEYVDTLDFHDGAFVDTENLYEKIKENAKVDTVDFFCVNLNKEKYKKGMRYYIWIGEDTGSTAAMFARCAQMNKIALLVGEETQINPDRYGNVIVIPWNGSDRMTVSFSTTKFEYVFEYESALYPDIEIRLDPHKICREGDLQIQELLKKIEANR
ncbi:MAG: S41 family peptidase [Bacteroidales bacterium]|nr:S41 family peptidase [Bacteroidales bacterium]